MSQSPLDNSVYNHLLDWTNLVNEENNKNNIKEERSSETRNVLFEKTNTQISDIEYLHNNLFKALKVPKSFFGFKDDISSAVTITQEIKEEPLTREVLFEKYNKFESLKKIRQNTFNKWANLGLLDGLQGAVKSNFAQLLEAQASCLLNDHSAYRRTYNVPVGISSRGFDSKPKKFFSKIKYLFISIWKKIFKKKKKEDGFPSLLPIAMRVASRTIGLDLVSVQPLSLPTGLLFYMDSQEREDVYTSKVIVEKYKKYNPMPIGADYYLPQREGFAGRLPIEQDYFIPVR